MIQLIIDGDLRGTWKRNDMLAKSPNPREAELSSGYAFLLGDSLESFDELDVVVQMLCPREMKPYVLP